MQSAESRSHDPNRVDGAVARLSALGRRWLGLPALLVWFGVWLYGRFRPVTVVPYTVGLVGAAVGLTLVTALLEADTDGSGTRLIPTAGRRSLVDRLVLLGCLGGVVAGTAGMLSAAGGITARSPQFADSALIAAALVIGSLVVLVGRWFGPIVAGVAVVGLGAGWLAAPPGLSVLETMAYDGRGIYGPLTRAAASWIAPVALLAGLWRTSGTVDQLRRLVPRLEAVDGPSTGDWLTGRRLTRGLWQLTPPVGVVALLIAWQADASYLQVVGVAAVPAAVCWLAVLVAGRVVSPLRIESADTVDWRAWGRPLVVAGGPLAVMGVLLVGSRLSLETVLLAGCLLTVGLCLAGPTVGFGVVDRSAVGRLRIGVRTVADGSVVGLGLFARIAVLLAVVGGITAVIQSGLSARLLSSLLWLAGRRLLAVAVLGGCCVVLGVALPVVAGYATGAVVVVPLLVTLTGVSELTAQFVVWYGAVGGWLVAPVVGQRLRRLGGRWLSGGS